MRKQAIFVFLIVFLFIVIIVGYVLKNNLLQNNNISENNIQEGSEINFVDDVEYIEVNSGDEKTTPNTMLFLKKKYTNCEHEIINRATIPEEMVNLTKEDIESRYSDWELEEFSKEKIILTKSIEGFCGEHYLLKEEGGKINIYALDEEGEGSFKKTANIELEYLPETDRISLRNGIIVYGTENLNQILEDYET